MKRIMALTSAAVAVAASALIGLPSAAQTQVATSGWVRQIGTYDYLVQPDFAGVAPLSAAVGNATIGLGTFDGLDGELVLIGGTVYRVGTDGQPRVASLDRTTPWFQGVRFSPQVTVSVAGGTACSDLIPIINAAAGSAKGLVAVRINGHFADLTARSVPAQSPPYRPLPEVVAEQVTFPLTDARATLVGFRSGTDVLGIGQPGLHLHGLTRDRTAGGHVLSCTVGSGAQLSIQRTRGVQVLASSQ